jgi:drug/metabolite transporter (DMT)-like permease
MRIKVPCGQIIGVFGAVIGCAISINDPFSEKMDGSKATLTGDLMGLGAGFFSAVFFVFNSKLADKIPCMTCASILAFVSVVF